MLYSCQGLCDGAPCIKIYVAKKTPGLLAQIPATIAGQPVTARLVRKKD